MDTVVLPSTTMIMIMTRGTTANTNRVIIVMTITKVMTKNTGISNITMVMCKTGVLGIDSGTAEHVLGATASTTKLPSAQIS